MSRVFMVRRRHFGLLAVMTAALIMTAVIFQLRGMDQAVTGTPSAPRVMQLITVEFETKMADGRELEVYRWDPGNIVIRKGETVELQITGVSGGSHPFVIEGLNVKGEVRKGETTSVTVTPTESGTYPIVCLTHMEKDQGGPMVGYIVVP